MNTLGVSLLVLGSAFLFSGLIFMFPNGPQRSAPKESFEESQERADYYLQQMREESGELSARGKFDPVLPDRRD
jgi:hypothetical protein